MNDCPVWLCENGNYWQAKWRDASGRLRSRGLGNKKKISKRQATVTCRRLAAEMMLGQSGPVGRSPTLEEWSKQYLKQRTDLGKATKEMHAVTCRYLSDYFGGDVRIGKLTRAMTPQWRAWMTQQGITETTVCGHVRTAKVIFKAALTSDLIGINPFDKLNGMAPKPDKDWHYISRGDLDKLVDACPDASWRAVLGLCRLAGLRRGEALAMPWSRVDWQQRRLTVWASKTAKSKKVNRRVIPITQRLYELLLEAHELAEPGDKRVWTHHGPGRGVDLHARIIDIISRAGFKPWREPWKVMRRNCATDWAKQHAQHVVSYWMGHSMDVSADHYLQVSDGEYDRVTQCKIKQSEPSSSLA